MSMWLFFMPESPFYLVGQGKLREAEESLRRLRSSKQDISIELKKLETAKRSQEKIGSISLATLLTEKRYLKPFVIAMSLMFLQQFGGVNAIMFYTQTIFEKAGSSLDSGMNKNYQTFTSLSTFNIVFTLLLVFLSYF